MRMDYSRGQASHEGLGHNPFLPVALRLGYTATYLSYAIGFVT